MEFDIKLDCAGVDWKTVSETLKKVGMGYHDPDIHRSAFEASHTTVFIYDADRLIGFGRAISDGEYQAGIYDVAVSPEWQRKGVGKLILQAILDRLSHCNVILYSSPGKEGFYRKFGFRGLKTGMAMFTNSAAMADKGYTD